MHNGTSKWYLHIFFYRDSYSIIAGVTKLFSQLSYAQNCKSLVIDVYLFKIQEYYLYF